MTVIHNNKYSRIELDVGKNYFVGENPTEALEMDDILIKNVAVTRVLHACFVLNFFD